MISKIALLVNYNLYESKRYFAQKFAEALRRKGFIVTIYDAQGGANVGVHMKEITDRSITDLTCSFNSIFPFSDGTNLWDRTHIPHWSILVDPSYYYTSLLKSPYSIVSCVDHYDCEFVRQHHFENVFFWPHAVEKELEAPKNQPRPYDVVFIGSCYDHDSLREYWQQVLPVHVALVIDKASEILLADHHTSLIPAINMALQHQGVDSHDVNFDEIVFCVDNYTRGKDRFELIQSVKDVHIHVFGGTSWRSRPPVRGWSQNLAAMPNVTVHAAINFDESLEILKQSKMCLNSMPFFKNGTHERIFTALACGCLPITMSNLWVEENFVDGEELVIYSPMRWNEVNDKVLYYLDHEHKRQEIADNGRNKVMQHHTWDNRVEEMIVLLDPILKRINE